MAEVQIFLVCLMIGVSAVTAAPESLWRGTAVFMLVFALFNLAVSPLLIHSDQLQNSPLNPFIAALMNFMGGFVLLSLAIRNFITQRKQRGKQAFDVFFLTFILALLFFVAMLVELLLLHDVNTDSFFVYATYEWMIIVLHLTQIAVLMGGLHYGRIHSKAPDSNRSGGHSRVASRYSRVETP